MNWTLKIVFFFVIVDVSSYKKVKFHLEDVKLVQIAQNNLEGTFRNIFSEIFKLLDWSSADI